MDSDIDNYMDLKDAIARFSFGKISKGHLKVAFSDRAVKLPKEITLPETDDNIFLLSDTCETLTVAWIGLDEYCLLSHDINS